MAQIDMNLDKKLVTVYGIYEGEVTKQLGPDIWRVKYVADGQTMVRSFFGVDLKYKESE